LLQVLGHKETPENTLERINITIEMLKNYYVTQNKVTGLSYRKTQGCCLQPAGLKIIDHNTPCSVVQEMGF